MKPNLLYLVHRIPYPPNKGDKIRSFHFLKALTDFYNVYLGTFIDDPEDEQYLAELQNNYCKDCFAVNLRPSLAKFNSLQGLLTGEALSLPYYRNKALQNWVDQTIEHHKINSVMIFSSPMAQYVAHHSCLNIVADFVDVDSDKWLQYSAKQKGLSRWVYRREAEKLLTFERKIAQSVKSTLLVSEQEADLFKKLAPESQHTIDYVNNGVDTLVFDPAISFKNPFTAEAETIVFTGAMDYWPNIDAVKWFAEHIFPLVQQQRPNVRFYIVGSKPSNPVIQLAEHNPAVIVTGRVDDVKPYIRYATVVVAPLRIARGIQNKVLEAMALAKPVVVSPAAMEGIAWQNNLAVALSDESPVTFAELVLQALQSPVDQAVVNREYVQTFFSWSESSQRLINILISPGNN